MQKTFPPLMSQIFFSVNILKIQVWFSWSTVGSAEMLPSASKRCLTDRIKPAAKAVATTTCIMGLICFKKWQGFLVILITWSLRITMTSINVIFLIWGFVQGNLGYIIMCCRDKNLPLLGPFFTHDDLSCPQAS